MKKLSTTDFREGLVQAALGQEYVRQCGVLFLITAEYERCAVKYGERAERYSMIEVGHAAQNLLLQTAALKLGATPIGAFHDEQITQLLPISGNHRPLLLVPVGQLQ